MALGFAASAQAQVRGKSAFRSARRQVLVLIGFTAGLLACVAPAHAAGPTYRFNGTWVKYANAWTSDRNAEWRPSAYPMAVTYTCETATPAEEIGRRVERDLRHVLVTTATKQRFGGRKRHVILGELKLESYDCGSRNDEYPGQPGQTAMANLYAGQGWDERVGDATARDGVLVPFRRWQKLMRSAKTVRLVFLTDRRFYAGDPNVDAPLGRVLRRDRTVQTMTSRINGDWGIDCDFSPYSTIGAGDNAPDLNFWDTRNQLAHQDSETGPIVNLRLNTGSLIVDPRGAQQYTLSWEVDHQTVYTSQPIPSTSYHDRLGQLAERFNDPALEGVGWQIKPGSGRHELALRVSDERGGFDRIATTVECRSSFDRRWPFAGSPL